MPSVQPKGLHTSRQYADHIQPFPSGTEERTFAQNSLFHHLLSSMDVNAMDRGLSADYLTIEVVPPVRRNGWRRDNVCDSGIGTEETQSEIVKTAPVLIYSYGFSHTQPEIGVNFQRETKRIDIVIVSIECRIGRSDIIGIGIGDCVYLEADSS